MSKDACEQRDATTPRAFEHVHGKRIEISVSVRIGSGIVKIHDELDYPHYVVADIVMMAIEDLERIAVG